MKEKEKRNGKNRFKVTKSYLIIFQIHFSYRVSSI